MGWREAVQAVPGGVVLLLEASPGAKAERFPDGYNPWRRRLGVRVREPAQEGQANDAIVRAVADFFGVPAAAVRVQSGHLDSRKSLLVAGLDVAAACALLEPSLGA